MMNDFTAQVFIVDDDPCLRDAIALNLKGDCCECTCFENADDCLKRLNQQKCDLLITDIKMPGMSGIELLTEVKRIAPWLPVLVMSAYGDIPLAVKAVKAGAADFVEKPLEWDKFLAAVRLIVKQNSFSNPQKGSPLTNTEMIVLRLIIQNKSNKEIAQVLHRSVRTVEIHRSHIMRKLDVDSVVELVKQASAMGLIPA